MVLHAQPPTLEMIEMAHMDPLPWDGMKYRTHEAREVEARDIAAGDVLLACHGMRLHQYTPFQGHRVESVSVDGDTVSMEVEDLGWVELPVEEPAMVASDVPSDAMEIGGMEIARLGDVLMFIDRSLSWLWLDDVRPGMSLRDFVQPESVEPFTDAEVEAWDGALARAVAVVEAAGGSWDGVLDVFFNGS